MSDRQIYQDALATLNERTKAFYSARGIQRSYDYNKYSEEYQSICRERDELAAYAKFLETK